MADPLTIGAAWRDVRDRFRAADIDTPELDARLLAQAAFGVDAMQLSTGEAASVPPEGLARLAGFAERRLGGEPVARILGHKEFYGLEFMLNAETLVPRPETELLVELALEALRPIEAPLFLDLGTGSGCIAVAVLANAPHARAIATDISPRALEAAEENAARHGVSDRLTLRTGSWCAPLGRAERFDLVLSNPPYVETDIIAQLQPEVSSFDPHIALDGGDDGLDAYRAIALGVSGRLKPGGRLIVEIGSEQGLEAGALLANGGFSGIDIRKDLAGLDRAIIAHQIPG